MEKTKDLKSFKRTWKTIVFYWTIKYSKTFKKHFGFMLLNEQFLGTIFWKKNDCFILNDHSVKKQNKYMENEQ